VPLPIWSHSVAAEILPKRSRFIERVYGASRLALTLSILKRFQGRYPVFDSEVIAV